MKIQKTVQILNKRAKFEYEILDKYTAGIVLVGTEIKSIRLGKASIAESFCEFNDKGELFVINSTIEAYDFGTHYNHRPKTERKLLLQKKELRTHHCAAQTFYQRQRFSKNGHCFSTR